MTKRELMGKLDYTKVSQAVSKKLNCDIELELNTIKEIRGETYGTLVSKDLASEIGLFTNLLETCRVEVAVSAMKDLDDGSYRIWASATLRYNMLEGGSNGMRVADVVWNVQV